MVLKTIAMLGALGALVLPGSCSQQAPTVDQVVAATEAACQFVPTAQSIETVLNADTTVTQLQDIVNIICSAVGPAPAAVRKEMVGQSISKNVYINGKVYVINGTFN